MQGILTIGDWLGKTLAVDDNFIFNPQWFVAKVFIELDVMCGIFESIDLIFEGACFTHVLDYISAPFRCLISMISGTL